MRCGRYLSRRTAWLPLSWLVMRTRPARRPLPEDARTRLSARLDGHRAREDFDDSISFPSESTSRYSVRPGSFLAVHSDFAHCVAKPRDEYATTVQPEDANRMKKKDGIV